ncbi:hypothetical protein ACF0H5_008430 [Mactra antiquata]
MLRDKYQDNYRSTKGVTIQQAAGSGAVELTNMPQLDSGDTAKPKAESSNEIENLTLHQCARMDDVESAKILLSNMGNDIKKINELDKDGLTPLHYAARYHQLHIVKLLVEKGASLSVTDEEGLTPLHFAARFKHGGKKPKVEDDDEEEGDQIDGIKPSDTAEDLVAQSSVIHYLINKHADINERDIYGQTPLHYACMRGNEIACKELLNYPSLTLEAVDKQGMTALHMAASHKQCGIVKLLIKKKASFRCKDKKKKTPLHAACTAGNVEIVKLLFRAAAIKGGKDTIKEMVNDKDIDGNTCLSLAVENGHYEVVKLCLEKRADVNVPNNIYMYPLHLGAVNGDLRIVRLLIEHKARLSEHNARIDVFNNEQATPLHKAAQYNHVQVVEYLVESKADIERKNYENYTPLLLASVHGKAATVDLLIQKKADTLLKHETVQRMINVSDRCDNSPLHIAAIKGYLPIVKTLLNKGADMDSKNDEEQTPLHLAAKFGRTNIVRALVTRDKYSVNGEDESSNKALHLAALAGHAKVADILIEFGADVAAKNENLWTPLYCAAEKGCKITAKVLLEAGSPINSTDKAGITPLHLACKHGHTGVVELLIYWEADVKQRDRVGNNCLDYAIDNNNADTAECIIKSNDWQEALRNHTLDLNSNRHDTPMRKMIRKMPEVAEAVFNRCMTNNKESLESKDYQVTFNYEFLDDLYSVHYWRKNDSNDSESSSGSTYDYKGHVTSEAKPYTEDSETFKENHPLMIMVTSKRKYLLAHPLVVALLRYKWTKLGSKLCIVNFLVYSTFLTFLTGYIVTTDAPYLSDTCVSQDAAGYKQPLFAKIGKYAIIILSVFYLLVEFIQIHLVKFKYLCVDNLIVCTEYVSSLLFVIDVEACQNSTGYRTRWQWNVGTVAIFLSWINLVLLVQKFPNFGIYVVMFKDILLTFLQFLCVFMLFIIAFALAFFALLQNQDSFSTVLQSLIKTSVMMIGEFEYDGIYTDGVVHYQVLAHMLFCVFMVVMSIIIMNLMVGLAVDNIKGIQEQAELKRKAMQVKLALDIERIAPVRFRRRFVVRKDTVKPNQDVNNYLNDFLGLESVNAQNINKVLNPDVDEIEKVKESQEKIQAAINEMKGQLNNIERIVKADALGISTQDVDFQELEDVGQSYS